MIAINTEFVGFEALMGSRAQFGPGVEAPIDERGLEFEADAIGRLTTHQSVEVVVPAVEIAVKPVALDEQSVLSALGSIGTIGTRKYTWNAPPEKVLAHMNQDFKLPSPKEPKVPELAELPELPEVAVASTDSRHQRETHRFQRCRGAGNRLVHNRLVQWFVTG